MADRILEVGAAGIEGADAKVKAMMNNMVNAETPAYKKSDVVIKSFPTYLEEAKIRSSTQVPQVQGTVYDQNPGTMVRTGNKYDVAIGGNGYFVIQTPWGSGYTRDGRFTLDKDGRLVTVAGNYPVLGGGGPISVTAGTNFEFLADGSIKADDGTIINTIKVVTINDTSKLSPMSGSIYKLNGGDTIVQDSSSPRLMSGYIESSNDNIIEDMADLVYLSHIYANDAKIISNREAMLSRALDIGKPAQ
jgi:flagellar basal-body rod protein FlgF